MDNSPQSTHRSGAFPSLDDVLFAAAKSSPTINVGDGRVYAQVPTGMKLVDVTDPDVISDHPATNVKVDDPESLSTYINRFSTVSTVIFADVDKLTVQGIIDYHSASELSSNIRSANGYARHNASLVLRKSEEFKRWNEAEGRLMGQAEFAAFLEENIIDVTDPEPTVLLEIARDLEAIKDVNFKSSVSLESGDRKFRYEDETKIKGEIAVPKVFALTFPLFVGDEPVTVEALLRYRITPDGLMLGFQWKRVQYMILERFSEIAAKVSADTDVPLMYGRVDVHQVTSPLKHNWAA